MIKVKNETILTVAWGYRSNACNKFLGDENLDICQYVYVLLLLLLFSYEDDKENNF